MKTPRITDLDNAPFVGPLIGPIFEAVGITDDDLPDIIPDDLDCDDYEAMVACFPKVVAKLEAAGFPKDGPS